MEIKATPTDLDDLFSGETKITLTVKNRTVRLTFREKDTATDVDHQRRLSKIKNRNGKVEPSDESLQADLWLFDSLCTGVEVLKQDSEQGAVSSEQKDSEQSAVSGKQQDSDRSPLTETAHRSPLTENWQDFPNFKQKISTDLKRQALFYYNQRIGPGADQGN